MSPDKATLAIITGWVTRLVDLCAHNGPKPGMEAVATYAVVLGQHFPSGAFTAESLAKVASAHEWFPPVAAVAKHVGEWWMDNKPAAAPMLTDGRPKPAGWTSTDDSWLRFYYRRRAEIAKKGGPGGALARANVDDLVRKQSPLAWEWINHGVQIDDVDAA